MDRISSMERELRSFNHRIVSTGLIVFFLSVSPLVGQMVSQSVGVKYPSKRSIDRLLGHLIITEESDANKYISTLTEFLWGVEGGGASFGGVKNLIITSTMFLIDRSTHHCRNVFFMKSIVIHQVKKYDLQTLIEDQ